MQKIIDDTISDPRTKVFAYNRQIASGHKPTKKELLAVIVEVGLDEGLDVLASFNDGTARYINETGKILVWETYIKSIQDITSFVKEQKERIGNKKECFFVIDENIIDVNSTLKTKFSIPNNFTTAFVDNILSEFENTKSVSSENFEQLLIDNQRPERLEFVGYIKNYQNVALSRYLLKKAIAYRKGELGTCKCMCEDLLMFSYFVSKNKDAIDFDLIMAAKVSDFDTWCGFDGEMVFYTFGLQQTKDYIKVNKDRLIREIDGFIDKTADYFIESFDENYLYNDINSRAFWYL